MVSTNPGPICTMSNVGSGVPNSFNAMALASDTRCRKLS